MSPDQATAPTCRLCGGSLSRLFSKHVLGTYDIDYLECVRCKSLQTTEPFWLGETYDGTLPNLDEGAARRSLRTCSIVLLSSKVLGMPRHSRLLDFGGGDGLVCRLLRDAGFEAYVYDKYAANFYAGAYSGDPDAHYDIVSAIEVLEHLANPNVELAQIFSSRPKIVIVSTDRYSGQGKEWSYLGPEQGGHVFFYSREAMMLIGERYGYHVVSYGSTAVFIRGHISRLRQAVLTLSLRPMGLLVGRIWLQLIRPRRTADPAAAGRS